MSFSIFAGGNQFELRAHFNTLVPLVQVERLPERCSGTWGAVLGLDMFGCFYVLVACNFQDFPLRILNRVTSFLIFSDISLEWHPFAWRIWILFHTRGAVRWTSHFRKLQAIWWIFFPRTTGDLNPQGCPSLSDMWWRSRNPMDFYQNAAMFVSCFWWISPDWVSQISKTFV